MTVLGKYQECPSCGGAGGGPFGLAGSAWDNEDYVCPRCEGAGVVLVVDVPVKGIAKTSSPSPPVTAADEKKRVG